MRLKRVSRLFIARTSHAEHTEIVILTSDFKVCKLLKASYAIWPGNGVGLFYTPDPRMIVIQQLSISASLSPSPSLAAYVRLSVCMRVCVYFSVCLSPRVTVR